MDWIVSSNSMVQFEQALKVVEDKERLGTAVLGALAKIRTLLTTEQQQCLLMKI